MKKLKFERNNKYKMIYCCNELNCGYAADGNNRTLTNISNQENINLF